MQYGFVIDNRKCIGCHACTVACKTENHVSLGVNRTWVKYVEKGAYPNTRRVFQVTRCNHCEKPPCVTICPTTASVVIAWPQSSATHTLSIVTIPVASSMSTSTTWAA